MWIPFDGSVALDECLKKCSRSRSSILPGLSCQPEFESKLSTRNASATSTSILTLGSAAVSVQEKNQFPRFEGFVFYRLPPCQCSGVKGVLRKIGVAWGPRWALGVLSGVHRFESCTSPIFPKSLKFKVQVYVLPLFKNLIFSSKSERRRLRNRNGVLKLRTWSQNRT